MAAASSRLGRKIIELHGVSKAFDGRTVIEYFSYNLLRDDRIGIVGTIMTGIFIHDGLISGTSQGVVVFLFHLLAVAIVIAYTFGMSYLGYWLIDKFIPMRVSIESEKVGLDLSQHDEHYGLAHFGERELAEYEEHIRNKEK